MVQWLRLHPPMQGVWVGSLVRELRFPHATGCSQKVFLKNKVGGFLCGPVIKNSPASTGDTG